MVGRRKYEEGCAVSHALDVIGERWALVVVRELLLGPNRFTDLRAGMPGASPDVLAQRLRQLQEPGEVTIAGDSGVLARFRQLFPLPEPAGTSWGCPSDPPTGGPLVQYRSRTS